MVNKFIQIAILGLVSPMAAVAQENSYGSYNQYEQGECVHKKTNKRNRGAIRVGDRGRDFEEVHGEQSRWEEKLLRFNILRDPGRNKVYARPGASPLGDNKIGDGFWETSPEKAWAQSEGNFEIGDHDINGYPWSESPVERKPIGRFIIWINGEGEIRVRGFLTVGDLDLADFRIPEVSLESEKKETWTEFKPHRVNAESGGKVSAFTSIILNKAKIANAYGHLMVVGKNTEKIYLQDNNAGTATKEGVAHLKYQQRADLPPLHWDVHGNISVGTSGANLEVGGGFAGENQEKSPHEGDTDTASIEVVDGQTEAGTYAVTMKTTSFCEFRLWGAKNVQIRFEIKIEDSIPDRLDVTSATPVACIPARGFEGGPALRTPWWKTPKPKPFKLRRLYPSDNSWRSWGGGIRQINFFSWKNKKKEVLSPRMKRILDNWLKEKGLTRGKAFDLANKNKDGIVTKKELDKFLKKWGVNGVIRWGILRKFYPMGKEEFLKL